MADLWSLGGVTITVEQDSGDILSPKWGLLDVLDSESSTIAHYAGEEGIKRNLQFVSWSGYHPLIEPLINGSGHSLISDQGFQGDYMILSSKPKRLQDINRQHEVYRTNMELLREYPLGTGESLGASGHGGFAYTNTAITGNSPPVWTTHNTGLSDATYIWSLCKDPHNPKQAACIDNSNGVFVTSRWRPSSAGAPTNWVSKLTNAEATTLVETKISLSIDIIELEDMKWFSKGSTKVLLVVANYRIDQIWYTRILRSIDNGETWICGGAILSYSIAGDSPYSYHYRRKHKDGEYGAGELVYDGTYLWIAAGSPYNASYRRSTLNKSLNWGETWPFSPITGLDDYLEGGAGPACARTGSNGIIYLCPWKKIYRYHDDGSGDGDEGYGGTGDEGGEGGGGVGTSHLYRSVRCSDATPEEEHVKGFSDTYVTTGGSYIFNYAAGASAGGCPNHDDDCPTDQIVKVGITLYQDDNPDFSSPSAIFATGLITQKNISGSEVIIIGSNQYVRADVSFFVGSCEGGGGGGGSLIGPLEDPPNPNPPPVPPLDPLPEDWFESSYIVGVTDTPIIENDIEIAKDIDTNDGYARRRGMLTVLSNNSWAALVIPSGASETSETTLEIVGVPTITLGNPYREIHGFERSSNIIYLGRSWENGEKSSSEPEIVLLSQDKGVSFSDISGNIALTSVTGFITDQSED